MQKNSRFDETEDQISDLEKVVKTANQSRKEKKEIQKYEDTVRNMWDNMKHKNICVIEYQKEERQNKEMIKYLKT